MSLTNNCENNKSKNFALFLSVLPVLMMYKTPFIGLGLSTTLIIICSLFSVIIIITQIEKIRWKLVAPVFVYLLYVIMKCIGSWIHLLLYMVATLHIIAISTGVINTVALKKYIKCISVIAAVAVIIQTLIYYVFKLHLPLIHSDLCLDTMNTYRSLIKTGFVEGSSFYRPSAFFLEPAHFAQYTCIGLSFCLIKDKPDYKNAIIISLGNLLTTSGIGIATTLCVWLWHVLSLLKISSFSNRLKVIFSATIIGSISIFFALQLSSVRIAVARFLGSDYGGISASQSSIFGRTLFWERYISSLRGYALIFGKGVAALPEEYLTGLMTIIYSCGIIGVMLFYFSIIRFFRFPQDDIKCIALLYGGLMIVANINGFIPILFYFGTVHAIIDPAQRRVKCDMLNE